MPVDYQTIKKFLETGVSPNETNELGEGLLHTYLRGENPTVEGVQLLFEKGADLNLRSNHNNTPLHLYLRKDNPNYDIVKLCIENKADLNLKGEPYFDMGGRGLGPNRLENSILNLYLRETSEIDLKILELLLEHGANPNEWVVSLRAPLFTCLCSKQPNLEAIKLLIQYGADLNLPSPSQYDDGYLPIHFYMRTHEGQRWQAPLDLRVINWLFQNGTKPDLFCTLGEGELNRQTTKMKACIAFMLLATGAAIPRDDVLEAFYFFRENDFLNALNHLSFFKEYLQQYVSYHLTDNAVKLMDILPKLRALIKYPQKGIDTLLTLSNDVNANQKQSAESIVQKYANYFWMQDMSKEVVSEIANVLQKRADEKETRAEWDSLLSRLDSDTKQNVMLLDNMILKRVPKEILLLIRQYRGPIIFPDFMDEMTERLIPLSRGP